MPGNVMLVNPCGMAAPPQYALAARYPLPPKATLGLLDNGKTNAKLILDQIAEALVQQLEFVEVVHLRKPGVAHPCPDEQLQAFANQCTVVVNGVGD